VFYRFLAEKTVMADLIEAVPGTWFLLPVVGTLLFPLRQFIESAGVHVEHVLGIAALLAIPVGWLALQAEGFGLSYQGRYEDQPTMRHLRNHIKFTPGNEGKHTVDLSEVLGGVYPNTTITCGCQQEFDKLFDPFKILEGWPCSFRKKQHNEKWDLPYVENVENMIFFSKEAYSAYIREMIRYWHVALASVIGLIFGLGIAAGIWLMFLPLMFGWGMFVVSFLVLVLLALAAVQTSFRKKEAVANESLLLRLMVPVKDCASHPPKC
jgi:uncharacterized membrane protein